MNFHQAVCRHAISARQVCLDCGGYAVALEGPQMRYHCQFREHGPSRDRHEAVYLTLPYLPKLGDILEYPEDGQFLLVMGQYRTVEGRYDYVFGSDGPTYIFLVQWVG